MTQTLFGLAHLGKRAAENRREAIEHSKKCEVLIPVHEPWDKADVFVRKESRPDGFNEDGSPRSIEVSIFKSPQSDYEYYIVKGSEGDRPLRVTLPKSIMKPLSSARSGKTSV